MIGTILVHLDWPWVYEPQEIKKSLFKTCENIVETLGKIPPREIQAVVLTPRNYKNYPLPHALEQKIRKIESHAKFKVTTADNLEDVGATIAEEFPHIQFWKVGGFWQDLCCADVRFGANIVKKAIIPAEWSTPAILSAWSE